MTIPHSIHDYDEGVHSDDDLIREVENYSERAEGGTQVQPPKGDLPPFALPSSALSSMGAGSLVDDAAPLTSGPHYACEDWVSRISIGKLKSIARDYRLGEIARWPSLNKTPCPSVRRS